jgi:HK97 gp10 family phage protein
MLTLRTNGTETTIANLDRFYTHAQKELAIAMGEVVKKIYFTAHYLVPVDTGKLMASLWGNVGRRRVWVEGFVGAKARYAIYVERGTSRTPAQPFLWPAVQQNQAFIYEKLGKSIHGAIQATARDAKLGAVIYGRM